MDAITLIAERRIAEAEEQGAFDDLPGRGRPLTLEDDSFLPEDLRMAYKVLRNAGYLPPELQDRKDVQTLLELLDNCTDERDKVRQMQKLQVVLRRIAMERGKGVPLTDEDQYYARILDRITLEQQKKDHS